MSAFFCPSCQQYLDSDIAGYHEIDDNVFFCDNCESKFHNKEYIASVNELFEGVKEES